MVIQKTVCDVPMATGRELFGRHMCAEPAITVGGRILEIMFGKEGHHVCMKHAELPLLLLCKLYRGDEKIGLVDDAQK